MMPMRRLLSMLQPGEIQSMRAQGGLLVPKVLMMDFKQALENTRPSVSPLSIEVKSTPYYGTIFS